MILAPPGEGERLDLGALDGSIKAGAGDALGSLAVVDVVVDPRFAGAALHSHDAAVDSFYVLEGVLTLQLGSRTLDAPPGTYAVVPPGNDHEFSNPRDEPVRMLNVMAPAGLEHNPLAS